MLIANRSLRHRLEAQISLSWDQPRWIRLEFDHEKLDERLWREHIASGYYFDFDSLDTTVYGTIQQTPL
jgi:hypothetical protein